MRRLTSRPFFCQLLVVQLSALQLLSVCLPSPARAAAPAQDLDEITISGRVADGHGASVVGAKVSAVLDTTGAARETTTDGEGRFRLVELAPGSYTVRVSAEGFAAETRGYGAQGGREWPIMKGNERF